MVMKKKILLVVPLFIGIIGAFGVGVYANFVPGNFEEAEIEQSAEQMGKVYEKQDYEYDVLSKDNEIPKEAIEDKVQQIKAMGDETDEKELYDKVAEDEKEKKALYLAACEDGIEVTEEEIDEVIEKVQLTLSDSEEVSSQLNAFIEGASMTEGEYWEEVRDVYKRNLMIQKYLQKQTEKSVDGQEKTESEIARQIAKDKEEEFDVSVEE